MSEQEPVVNQDIRWRNVWATIRPYERTAFDLETNTRKEPMTVVFVEVRWEGERFVARYLVEDDLEEHWLLEVLDRCVINIDRMLVEHGFPPYYIRSE